MLQKKQLIAEGRKEIDILMAKKSVNKEKLLSSYGKISMGLERKSELSVEIELVRGKKRSLMEVK